MSFSITDTTSCFHLMVDADNMVVVTDSGFTGPDIAADGLNIILPVLFREWFQDNMSAFLQIFSVIILDLKTENSDFQWLYPSACSYATNSSLNNNTTGFGVLTLIDGKTDTGSLQQSVDI